MAATYAKGLPQAVSAFAHAADRLTPEQQQQHDRGVRKSSFRADASSSSSSSSTSEFGRFAQHAGPNSSAFQAIGFEPQQAAAAWERTQTGRTVPSAIPAQSTFASQQDGDALVALLNGHDSVVEAVDGDWERQLAQEQQRSASAVVSPLPADPLASKPVPQLLDTARRANPGDMSPTSESLLASVSNLSLAEQTYLRTLLASQDPAAMFQDYFSRATYTDDVWTPITSGPLRDVLDRAAQDTGKGKGKERVDDEEGKAKAVRRLEMVLRHLNGQMGSTAAGASSLATSETRAGRLGGGNGGGGGGVENHLANLATPPSTVADPRASDTSAHAYSMAGATSTSFAAPSSLSSSAFVSFSPPVAVHSPATLQYYPDLHHHVAPSSSSAVEHIDAQNPPVATPYDHPRPATQPRRANSYASSQSSAESNGTDASYEEYAKEKEARMRSNEGGRFGPDFSSMGSVYGGGGVGGGERGGVDVTEGRTH